MKHNWQALTPAERREALRNFFGTIKGVATTLIALTFFVREVGKK